VVTWKTRYSTLFKDAIYFIFGLFNDAVSISEKIASNDRLNNEVRI
jgi:hypothetical protein